MQAGVLHKRRKWRCAVAMYCAAMRTRPSQRSEMPASQLPASPAAVHRPRARPARPSAHASSSGGRRRAAARTCVRHVHFRNNRITMNIINEYQNQNERT